MADSDNTTTLSNVTRSKAIAGRAPTVFSPNNSEASSETQRLSFGANDGLPMKRRTDFAAVSSAVKRIERRGRGRG
nr:hypothetical protein [Mesorhizobium loti]